MQDVLVKGNEVLSNPVATKEQVTEIMAQLQDAFANLIPLDENRKALISIIDEFNKKDQESYTEASWNAYKEFIDGVIDTLNQSKGY